MKSPAGYEEAVRPLAPILSTARVQKLTRAHRSSVHRGVG
jgi:hypothetical protein